MIRLELKVTYAMLREWCFTEHLSRALAELPHAVRSEIYDAGYAAGREAGYEEGVEEGVEQGKQFRNANDLGVANVHRDTAKQRRNNQKELVDLLYAAKGSARRRTRSR